MVGKMPPASEENFHRILRCPDVRAALGSKPSRTLTRPWNRLPFACLRGNVRLEADPPSRARAYPSPRRSSVMNGMIALEILAVLICWVVLGHAIWKWGPGLRRRSVRCPEKRVGARVLADQREAGFGCLKVVEVKECSLFENAPLACGKGCLARL